MNVGIIGSGNVGGALARSAARAGHHVTIASLDADAAEEIARAVGGRSVSSNAEVVEASEVTFLAVPAAAVADLAGELGPSASGRVLVDVTNRPTPDPDADGCLSSAEEVQARAPEARVVKAINTVFASRQAKPDIGGTSADGYVAGDDQDAKRQVLEFVKSIGLTPYDVGPLAVARTLEGMAWIHISLAMQNDWRWESAWKIVGPKG